MIPKYIHYCWYGQGEKPQSFYKCLESWKKYFPDYEIIEWNESNSDIQNSIAYVQEAYEAKKYAFVSDYFRLKAIYEYGGIYFDTDYEVLRPIEELFKDGTLITGFESKESLLTAMIAVEKNNPIISSLLDRYKGKSFIKEDGTNDLTTINYYFSQLMKESGIDLSLNSFQRTKDNVIIYPIDVLCGYDMDNCHEKITSGTYGVHHMLASWVTDEGKWNIKKKKIIQKLLGYRLYDFLKENLYNKIRRR